MADAHEAMGKINAMASEIEPVAGTTSLCGPACTVRIPPGDNLMVHVGSQVAEPGDVLVVAAETTRAVTWGELLTLNAIERGLEGIVSAGNVRDTERLSGMGFPVFAAAVSQSGAVKKTLGAVNVPVAVGGVAVEPGDVVIGDRDGVTVVPRDDAEAVLDEVAKIEEREARAREQISAGETLFEIGGYDEKLDALGAEPIDSGNGE